jgi:hypothetical protein
MEALVAISQVTEGLGVPRYEIQKPTGADLLARTLAGALEAL